MKKENEAIKDRMVRDIKTFSSKKRRLLQISQSSYVLQQQLHKSNSGINKLMIFDKSDEVIR